MICDNHFKPNKGMWRRFIKDGVQGLEDLEGNLWGWVVPCEKYEECKEYITITPQELEILKQIPTGPSKIKLSIK